MNPHGESTVAQFSFDPSSLRVKKAKLARLLRKRTLKLLQLFTLLLVGGGLFLLWSGSSAGYFVLALAVALVVLLAWNHWELSDLHRAPDEAAAAGGRLDELLATDIVSQFSWPASPQAIWQAISGHWHVQFLAVRFGIDPWAIEPLLSRDAAASGAVIQTALNLTNELGFNHIRGGALAVALLNSSTEIDSYLAGLGLERDDVAQGLRWLTRVERIIEKYGGRRYFGGLARDWTGGYTPLLNQLGQDLSSEVQAGAAYHGETNIRADLIEQMISNLSQPSRSNVCLVGDTGVGKTLTVYSLAERLLTGESPRLKYHHIMKLNASAVVANAKQPGEAEQILLQVLAEVSQARNVILFLDDAEVFFSEGVGAIDLSKLLMPVLQHNAIRLILAMTPADWQKLQADNSGLAGLVNYLSIKEPTEPETIHILQDQTLLIESKLSESGSKVRIMYQAIGEAYRLSGRYITDIAYPDRAIRLLENAVNYAQAGLVTAQSVQQAIEVTQGVKVTKATAEEGQQLLNLEEQLHQLMINQSRAVKVVADALRRSRAGVSNQNRPVGTFLFLGPTGVGKTELSKSLAAVYFGGVEHMIRIDMTEYSRPEDVTRFLDPGTANSSITLLSQVRATPFAVILFDEIEKAHPDVLNLFLQLIDEGRLTDNTGKPVSFKDAIIITTSNAGADRIREQIQAGKQLDEFEEQFTNELIDSGQFKPEFLNRFDEIVLFRPLTPAELKQVVGLMIADVNKTLEPKKIQVGLTDAAAGWLVEKGNDPRLGARPMRRMIQRTVENVVAQKILQSHIQPGQQVVLDVADIEQAKPETNPT